jgi:hypothetical protein
LFRVRHWGHLSSRRLQQLALNFRKAGKGTNEI